MTRYDTFILYAFLIVLLVRLILAQALMRSRSYRIMPWANLNGQRTPRGKGVTLLVRNHWLAGSVYGQLHTGAIVIRTTDGSFTEIEPGEIESVRIYDL